MTKLALIINKSKPYISFQKERVLESWEAPETKPIERLGQAGGASLFGDTPVSILHVDDTEKLKEIVFDLEELIKNNKFNSIVDSGLLIICEVGQNSTRKIEKIFNDNDGQVFVTKSGDKTPMTEKLLKELSLSKDAHDFLLHYVGQDYEELIPIIRTISKLSPKQQKAVSIDDLIIRLPRPPGSVPPWEIEKPLFQGDIPSVIEIYRRASIHTHVLVTLTILKNKLQLAYKISSIIENQKASLQDISNILSVANNYPLKLAEGYARRFGRERLESAVQLIYKTQQDVKTNPPASINIIMETFFVQLCYTLGVTR